MTLLHWNMVAMTAACLCLLVGYSYRHTRFWSMLMLLGAAGLMGLIVYNIRMMTMRG